MGHWRKFLASSILLFIAAFNALPQEANYRHYTDSSGNIVFAQKLTWQRYENIDHYRIEIEEISKTSRRAKVLDKTTEENSIEVKLPAGTYRYRISIYNVLGNLETKSDWKEFEIFKATQPKISSIFPENVEIEKDAEDKRKTLELTGENLLRQSKYRIEDEGGMSEGKVETADGNSASVTFDFQGFPAGEYKLTVKNPGGLESEAAFTLTIKEPEPVVEEPIVEEPEPIEEEPKIEEPEIEEPAEPIEEEPEVEEPEEPVEEEEEPFDFTTPDGSYSTEKIDSSSIVLGCGCGVQFTIWKGLYSEAEIGFKYTAELEMGTIEPKIMLGWKF